MTISRKKGVKVGVEDIWRNKVIKKEINGGGGGSGVLKLRQRESMRRALWGTSGRE